MVAWIILFIVIMLAWHYRRPKNFPPGPPRIPIFGSIPFIKLADFQLKENKLREKYGSVIGMSFGRRNVVFICGKKEVEEVLKRDEFQGRPNFNKNERGVIFSDGKFWVNQRRFALKHLRDFGFSKNSIEHVILGEVEEFFRASLENRDTVQVSDLFHTSSVNILWGMIGGMRYSHDDPEIRHLINCLRRRFRSGSVAGSVISRFPTLAKFLPRLKIFKDEIDADHLLREFLKKAVEEHRRTKEEEPRDFIDAYLDELDKGKDLHSSFSEITLRNICRDFFAAGTESLGSSLGFNLLYSVLYPDWQEQLHEEIVSVIGRDRKPELNDKKKLHKLEAFMTEVSRCNTTARNTVPHRCVSETTLNGYTIPENCMLIVNLNSVLQDKEYWGDPDNFRPERFLDIQGCFVKDKEGLPVFGIGKRICPGESISRNILFLFFASIVQKYQFSIPEGHPKPSTVCLTGFTQAPEPFEVAVKRRLY